MKPWILGGVSAAALIAIPVTGWSLTAQQAWEQWQAAAESYGQTLTNDGEESMGGKLSVRGVSVTADVEDADISAMIDEVVFAEQGDGTVTITMSDSFPLVVAGTDPETGEKIDLTVTIEQPGMQMTASDANGGTAFAFSAPSLLVKVTEFKIDDADFPMQMALALNDTTGSYSVKSEAGAPMKSSFEAGDASVNLNFVDPEGGGKLVLSATIDGIKSNSLGTGMEDANPDEMAKMLAGGFAVEGGATYGPVAFQMDFEETGETAKADGSLTGGGASFALSVDGMAYDVAYEGLDVAISGSEIPFPQVTLKADAARTAFSIPVLMSEAAAPFALRTALEGVTVGEEIWSMFDPAGVLPRDPATLIVDLAGTGRWSLDIFDEKAMMEVETSGATPGEVETLDINELKLAVGGAELTGEGTFKIDNSDLQTFNGMPRPEGKANFRLVGGNGLLDRLTQMGLVPPDQVMMVRMMTGMFAKPGTGADELLSEVAIDGSGKVLINGAPMPF